METELGSGWRVIEEGLNGRTTVFEDQVRTDRRGLSYLPMLLDTHSPLSLVIAMLGTNDTKTRFHVPVSDIGLGWARIADTVLRGYAYTEGRTPELLLVAPPVILPSPNLTETFEGAVEKSLRFAEILSDIARQFGCHFFDSGTVVQSSPIDGIHLSPESHITLAKAMAGLASKILVG